jgi:hypothetical protein
LISFVNQSPVRPSPIFQTNPMSPTPALGNWSQGGFGGSLLNFPSIAMTPSFGNLSGINSAFLGTPDMSQGSQAGFSSVMALLEQMIQMMSAMMQMASGGQVGGAATPYAVQSGSPMAGFNGGSPGSIVPASGGAGGGAGAASSVAAAEPSSPSTGNFSGSIGPGTKVLEIGDSHSVGTFGKELDAKLRGTGAQVSTYASAGATASTFTQGKSTKYGYWEKKADGSERTVGYGTNAQTPRLDDLISREKPSVILVNLGANFRQGDPKSQVDEIGRVAQKHGIPIIWVGPPKTSKDNSNPGSLQQFDRKMAAAVAPYGKYISSAGHTPKYSGGDGIHYGGSEGNQIARQWADGIFREVTR